MPRIVDLAGVYVSGEPDAVPLIVGRPRPFGERVAANVAAGMAASGRRLVREEPRRLGT